VDLGGVWQIAPSTDERRRAITAGADEDSPDGWSDAPVPGHWRNHPTLADSDGPVLYRREFTAPPPEADQRAFLIFEGIFYQGDVWLDGGYLGDTEGYFAPHSFEIGEQLRLSTDHTLTVEVTCGRPVDKTAKRNLTGVFQHWDCIDPDWNPGGIWRGVRLERGGPIRIDSFKVLCREANPQRATLDLEVRLDPADPGPVTLVTTVTGPDDEEVHQGREERTLSSGPNTVSWRLAVERPRLWWPRALGDQPLYEVRVEVLGRDGRASDARTATTGLRQVRMRDFVATVNGERMFLKGANHGPTRRDPATASAEEVRADVRRALDAGLDLLRVHAHIARPELYDEADRRGLLVWQDMPLQWGYGRVRRQAASQSRAAVEMLGHHPSIAVWCGHNEPMAVELPAGGGARRRDVAKVIRSQVLPTWNKTGLDRTIRRALERADHTRPVVAHSGVVPHPIWGTDSHFYFGWYHGDERDFPTVLARLPVLARFVSEFGAQSVPATADFMAPEQWPNLDWDHLTAHHSLQKELFDQRVSPHDFSTFDGWRAATQAYQADLLKHQIETLRRLKYRPTGGFCFFLLADAQPAVTWSVLDHERAPKAAFEAVKQACAPVIITASRPPAVVQAGERLDFDIHAVSDLRTAVAAAVVEAALTWPGGRRSWRFSGDLAADRCTRIGRVTHAIPPDCADGQLELSLQMRWDGGAADNAYRSDIRAGAGK
jgi:beta-mannosidase